jgi:hypothetical protein
LRCLQIKTGMKCRGDFRLLVFNVETSKINKIIKEISRESVFCFSVLMLLKDSGFFYNILIGRLVT